MKENIRRTSPVYGLFPVFLVVQMDTLSPVPFYHRFFFYTKGILPRYQKYSGSEHSMTIYRCGSILNMTYLCLCQSYELEKTRFKKKYFHPYFKRKFKLKTSRKISESTLQKYPTTCWNWNKMNYKINPHTC